VETILGRIRLLTIQRLRTVELWVVVEFKRNYTVGRI